MDVIDLKVRKRIHKNASLVEKNFVVLWTCGFVWTRKVRSVLFHLQIHRSTSDRYQVPIHVLAPVPVRGVVALRDHGREGALLTAAFLNSTTGHTLLVPNALGSVAT